MSLARKRKRAPACAGALFSMPVVGVEQTQPVLASRIYHFVGENPLCMRHIRTGYRTARMNARVQSVLKSVLFFGVQQLQKHIVDGLGCLHVLTRQGVAVHIVCVHVLAVAYKVFYFALWQLLCHAHERVPQLIG